MVGLGRWRKLLQSIFFHIFKEKFLYYSQNVVSSHLPLLVGGASLEPVVKWQVEKTVSKQIHPYI